MGHADQKQDWKNLKPGVYRDKVIEVSTYVSHAEHHRDVHVLNYQGKWIGKHDNELMIYF